MSCKAVIEDNPKAVLGSRGNCGKNEGKTRVGKDGGNGNIVNLLIDGVKAFAYDQKGLILLVKKIYKMVETCNSITKI